MLQFEELENHVQQFARKYDLMYNPTKASIEAKCTLRDVYLRKGFTPEYLDDWAMGLLGKSKTLWKADF